MKKSILTCILLLVAILLCACGLNYDHSDDALGESITRSTESKAPFSDTSEEHSTKENSHKEDSTDRATEYPPEPPTVLSFDSLSELEAFIVVSMGTQEEIYQYASSTHESATRYAIDALPYERIMEISANIRSCNIPKLTEETAPDEVGIHYTHDYDCFEVIYIIGEERYRFAWFFDKEISPITDRNPVVKGLVLGDTTVDIYELDNTGGYDNFYTNYTDGTMAVLLTIHANDVSDISFDIFTFEPILQD